MGQLHNRHHANLSPVAAGGGSCSLQDNLSHPPSQPKPKSQTESQSQSCTIPSPLQPADPVAWLWTVLGHTRRQLGQSPQGAEEAQEEEEVQAVLPRTKAKKPGPWRFFGRLQLRQRWSLRRWWLWRFRWCWILV